MQCRVSAVILLVYVRTAVEECSQPPYVTTGSGFANPLTGICKKPLTIYRVAFRFKFRHAAHLRQEVLNMLSIALSVLSNAISHALSALSARSNALSIVLGRC
jgi:hypothetical protein